MASDIVKFEAQALDGWIRNAEALAASDVVPKQYRGKPANILVAIQTGAPLGYSVMESINGIHIIEGKPSMSADLIAASVRNAGHRLRVTGDDKSATAQIIRADDPDFVFEVTWTIDRARQAQLLNKDNWKKYPAAMLKARAITEVAREAANDALHGVIYAPEEIGGDLGHMEATARSEAPAAPAAPPAPVGPSAAEAAASAGSGQPGAPKRSQDWKGAADACANPDLIRQVWKEAQQAGELNLPIEDGATETVKEYLNGLGFKLAAQQKAADQAAKDAANRPSEPEVIEGEIIEDEPLEGLTGEHAE